MIEHMGWVVITFTAGRCEETDWPACPMSAEWFDTREDAVAYCATLPGWTSPHLMPVTRRSIENVDGLRAMRDRAAAIAKSGSSESARATAAVILSAVTE